MLTRRWHYYACAVVSVGHGYEAKLLINCAYEALHPKFTSYMYIATYSFRAVA